MQAFNYAKPSSLADAARAAGGADAKLLAGGQSLLAAMKLGLAAPSALVDLGGLKELQGISVSGGTVKIGAMTTHAAVAASKDVQQAIPALAALAGGIGDRQVRNRGTIGGSVAHADPAGDIPAAVLALDAEIKCVGPNGERWIKCADFFLGLLMSVLEPDEIVTAIRVPVTGGDKTAYLKAAPRSSGFAVVGVAVRLSLDASGTCTRAAIAITGVTDKAYRAERVEQMLTGKKPEGSVIDQAAAEATRNVEVVEDINGSTEYRKHLAGVYVARALNEAISR